jgi:hypothetical protein
LFCATPLHAAVDLDETNDTRLIVRDATGYFYFEEEPRRGEWQSTSPICQSSYSGEL